jgi:hypothetical protein
MQSKGSNCVFRSPSYCRRAVDRDMRPAAVSNEVENSRNENECEGTWVLFSASE